MFIISELTNGTWHLVAISYINQPTKVFFSYSTDFVVILWRGPSDIWLLFTGHLISCRGVINFPEEVGKRYSKSHSSKPKDSSLRRCIMYKHKLHKYKAWNCHIPQDDLQTTQRRDLFFSLGIQHFLPTRFGWPEQGFRVKPLRISSSHCQRRFLKFSAYAMALYAVHDRQFEDLQWGHFQQSASESVHW